MNEIILRTNKLTKKYKNQKAADQVSITIKKGDIYGLIGENGSGKSTIIKMILGLVSPTSGEVEIFGETSEEALNKGRGSIGSIVESPVFYPYLSAYKNLEYYRIQKGIEDDKLIDEVLSLVGLVDVRNKKFKTFSLGMKQRLGLAFAIMINPEILILDEPINGLDPSGIVELRKILLRLNREKGVTIFLSSHILGELSQVASKYGFISKGKLLKEVRAEELNKECKSYLRIIVEDMDRALLVLESKLNTLDYKVTNEGEIQLFDYIDRPEIVSQVLGENEIYIRSLSEEGLSLEDYYMDLIGGDINA